MVAVAEVRLALRLLYSSSLWCHDHFRPEGWSATEECADTNDIINGRSTRESEGFEGVKEVEAAGDTRSSAPLNIVILHIQGTASFESWRG